MKGKDKFTQSQADLIRDLLHQKIRSGNLKPFRDELRRLGFYITDFASYSKGGFSADDFNRLVESGRIIIA